MVAPVLALVTIPVHTLLLAAYHLDATLNNYRGGPCANCGYYTATYFTTGCLPSRCYRELLPW